MDKKLSVVRHPVKSFLRRWDVRYKYNKKHLVMDLIIAGAVLAIVGSLLFWVLGGLHYLVDKTEIKITLKNEEVIVGENNSFIVSYQNDNDFDLDEFSLALRLPNAFVAEKSLNENYDVIHNVLLIGRLKAGAAGSFELPGKIWGSVGEKQRLIVSASYYKTDRQGERLWGLFQSPYKFDYEIARSDLKIIVKFPERAVNGQIVNLNIGLENDFDFSLNKIFVQPLANENFQIIDGGKDYSDGAWTVRDFAPGAKKDIVARVRLSGVKKVEPAIAVYYEASGRKLEIAKIVGATSLFDSGFFAGLKVGDKTIQPGDTVDFSIDYNNAGSFSLADVKFKLELLSDYWNESVAVISAKDFSRLALIQPGEGGTAARAVAVKKYLPNVISNLQARLVITYKIGDLSVEILGEKINVPLSSDLRGSVLARYFTSFGEQLGRGPLPPKVGSETKYWIFVQVLNNVNDVDAVNISVRLAPDVSWLNKFNVSVGDPLVYDPLSGTVLWKISKVPAGAENFGFAFEVGLTPIAAQKGQYAPLVESVEIVGVDSVTGRELTYSVGAITTNLVVDKIGALKGGKVN